MARVTTEAIILDVWDKPLRTLNAPRHTLRAEIEKGIAEGRIITTIIQKPPYTCCLVSVPIRNGHVASSDENGAVRTEGVGFAKYNPNDADDPRFGWDPALGITIARGRAIKDVLSQVLRHYHQVTLG